MATQLAGTRDEVGDIFKVFPDQHAQVPKSFYIFLPGGSKGGETGTR